MPTWPSPRSERLGTPKIPAIRFTRGTYFGASRFTYATACQVARPPLTDRTRSPRPQRAFTSRLPAVWSPSLPLDITTTWTGLLLLAGLAPARMAASLAAPEPYVRLFRIRLPPWMLTAGRVAAVRVLLGRRPSLHRLRGRSPGLCSAASLLLWRSLTSHARASSATVPHLPDAGQSALQPVAGHEISQVPTRSFRT